MHFLYGASRGRFIALFFKEELKLSDSEVGLVLSVSHVFRIFATPVWGYVADKYLGRRKVYIISIFGSSLCFASNFIIIQFFLENSGSFTLYAVLLVRFLQSFFSSISYSLLDAEVLASAKNTGLSSEEVSGIWGRSRVYGAVGWGVASVILGGLLDIHGSTDILIPYSLFTSIVTSSIAYFTFEPFVGYESQKEAHASDTNFLNICSIFLSSFCTNLTGIIFLLVILVSSSGMILVEGLSFLFFSEDLNFNYLQLGFLVVITVAFELPLFHYSARIIEQMGYDAYIVIGLIGYITRVFVYTILPVDHHMFVIGVEWLHGVTIATITSARTLKFKDFTPTGFETTFQAILSALVAIGSFLGEFVGGKLFEAVGKRATYRVSCLTFVVVLFAHVISSKQFFPPKYHRVQDIDMSPQK